LRCQESTCLLLSLLLTPPPPPSPSPSPSHYLSGWFLIDLLGTIPFKLFVGKEKGASGKTIKLSKFLKIPKLLRISRVLKYMRDNRQVYDIFKVFVFVVISIHIGACIWVWALDPCPTVDGDNVAVVELAEGEVDEGIDTIVLPGCEPTVWFKM
jgi:hypothetical protein